MRPGSSPGAGTKKGFSMKLGLFKSRENKKYHVCSGKVTFSQGRETNKEVWSLYSSDPTECLGHLKTLNDSHFIFKAPMEFC